MLDSLRDAVPEELATWLDVESVHDTDCGKPGFSGLRHAWVGLAPTTAGLLAELSTWLDAQRAHQAASEEAWQHLVTVDPLPSDGRAIPQWYTEWWAMVLLSFPWDERLGDAVAAAMAYVPPQG